MLHNIEEAKTSRASPSHVRLKLGFVFDWFKWNDGKSSAEMVKGRRNTSQIAKRTSSVESTASVNITNSRVGSPRGEVTEDAPGNLFDCSALIIHCKKHDKYALQEVSSKKPGLWFPFAVVYRRSHEAAAKGRLKHLLQVPGGKTSKGYAPFSELDCLNILHLQVPHVKKFVTRYTYYTHFTGDVCCQHLKNFHWLSVQELQSAEGKMWGPEPIGFHKNFLSDRKTKETKMYDVNLREATRILSTRTSNAPARELIVQAGLNEQDILKWYSEFIQHCWPAQALCLLSFNYYFSSVNYFKDEKAKSQASRYFRAFAFYDNYFLTFKEFLMGIVASDKRTEMKGTAAELRCDYIMRYYDSDRDKQLNYSEMQHLVKDAHPGTGGEVKKGRSESREQEAAKTLAELNITKNSKVSEKDLKLLIGSLKIRGTSSLFRSNTSSKQTSGFLYAVIDESQRSMDDVLGRNKTQAADVYKCARCKDKKYCLATHNFRLTANGFVINPVELKADDVKNAPKISRKNSNEFFTPSLPNNILDMVREFSDLNKVSNGSARTTKPKDYLKHEDRKVLEQKLMKLCDMAEEVLKKEPRTVKLTSPCIVFGDIHGNLHDLMIFERLFWRKGPYLESWSYLFLGDYVDRGLYSLEVFMYLFAAKVQCPSQFQLLRGNHEVRNVNRSFTFYKELLEKLGPTLGPQMWERTNKVFDCLPCSAIIDDTLFCAHGGIPSAGSGVCKLSDLLTVPCPLSNPEEKSNMAWEMLWNDPVGDQQFGELIETTRTQAGTAAAADLYKNGFIFNTKRGTGYFYSEEAVKRFLAQNGLSHIIRAHEMCPDGYMMHHKGKTITVFSSSKYGGNNEAAVVIVDKNKIRPVKIDTNV